MTTLQHIKTIGIVGAGTMGQGIAQVCAVAGYDVLLYDIRLEIVQQGISKVDKSLQTAVEKNRLTAQEKQTALARIQPCENLAQLKADLIIEAVLEKLELKRDIFATLEQVNSDQCILTSNTSSIPITQIAATLKNPKRFAGFHFFNPAPVMKLVEVIQGAATDPAVSDVLVALAEKLGKVPVRAKDSPGFIVNRVARHYYVESLKLLEENVSDVKTIDTLLRSAGFKMGPFELMDLIGVDTNFSVTTSMFQAFHQDSKFRPSRIQQQKVDAGHHGRKSGKGFYDYQ
jgi:3-hydroxybutyryl-CoA dehydrogenase